MAAAPSVNSGSLGGSPGNPPSGGTPLYPEFTCPPLVTINPEGPDGP